MPAAGTVHRVDTVVGVTTVRKCLRDIADRATADGSAEDQRVIVALAATAPHLLGLTPANLGQDVDPLTEEGASWR